MLPGRIVAPPTRENTKHRVRTGLSGDKDVQLRNSIALLTNRAGWERAKDIVPMPKQLQKTSL